MLEARRSDDPPSTFNVDPLTVVDRGPLTEVNSSLIKSLQTANSCSKLPIIMMMEMIVSLITSLISMNHGIFKLFVKQNKNNYYSTTSTDIITIQIWLTQFYTLHVLLSGYFLN